MRDISATKIGSVVPHLGAIRKAPASDSGQEGSSDPVEVKRQVSISRTSTYFLDHDLYTVGNDQDDKSVDGQKQCGEQFVLLKNHVLIMIRSVILMVLLTYIATAFLFRFAFLTFHLDEDGINPLCEDIVVWNVLDYIVDALFWVDLIFNFFVSYEDAKGREVKDLCRIAKRYLLFGFWVNLIACLPTEAARGIINLISSPQDGSKTDFSVARIYRLHRISRLARLARLSRLMKVADLKVQVPGWQWFKSLRGVRITKFLLGLMLTCHVMASGWYLVAALHDNPKDTWVGRRTLTVNGETQLLLDQGPFMQWLTSMYFILTVFTTVGFGDISAVTEAEIVYVFLTMVVGAVVHSIIISEVIQVVTSTDRTDQFIQKQVQLLEAFSHHANLDPNLRENIMENLEERSRLWAENMSFDKDEMKTLLLSKYMPRSIIGRLPYGLHRGQLCKNLFLHQPSLICSVMPPRLPSLMAIHMVSAEFSTGEVVYQLHDFAYYLALVLNGTFACVGLPGSRGGRDAIMAPLAQTQSQKSHTVRSLSSDRTSGGSDKCNQRTSAPADQLNSEQGMSSHLIFPYRFFGSNSYFGDLECITSSMRKATVRCEHAGKILILKKRDLFELIEEFPQFGDIWASAAWRRECQRKKSLKKLKAPLNYRNLAATTVQRFVRGKLAARRRAAFEEEAGQKCTHESKPRVGEGNQIWYTTAPKEFSQTDLKNIASPGSIHTLLLKEIDKLQHGQNKMREEVREVRSDMKVVKGALGLLPATATEEVDGPWRI